MRDHIGWVGWARLGRRLRGEVRRLLHPVVGAGVVFAGGTCLVAQRSAPLAVGRGPAPDDLLGALRIAVQHHASGVGVALLAAGAAVTSASDARIGATSAVVLAGPTVPWLWARRVAVLVGLAAVSVLTSTVLLRTTAASTACRLDCPPSARSTGSAALADLASGALVVVAIAALVTVLALALRNELLVVVVALTAFFLPANHLGDVGSWATPTKWISIVMQFEPEGLGSDYTGGQSSAWSRGWPAVVAGSLLVAATIASGVGGVRLLERRAADGEIG